MRAISAELIILIVLVLGGVMTLERIAKSLDKIANR
jgi:hypothetical protein